MATLPITVDGSFSDWDPSEIITTPVNAVPGYSLYGTVQGDTYLIAIQGAATDQVIGAGTTIWLNTDQNTTTGYSPFGSIGAEYNITYIPNATGGGGAFYLYTGAAAQNLVSTTPLTSALSADGKSLEIAIPRSLVTPAGGTAPTNINVAGWINSVTPATQVNFPGDYTNPEYTITDPATLQAKTATHRVAIVYSDTTAALYFRGLGDAAGAPSTAYSDLFMAAQNQARMAGVSYDVIDESQLTNINNLIGYDALIFPAMADVNTAQLPAIMSTLTSAVYNYHIGIITSGDFLTNDQTGAPLPNPYANMETLLGLARASGGNSGTVTVTANDVSNPIMSGYTAGQVIHTYTNEGYTAYQGVGGVTPDVLVNQNVTDPALTGGAETIPGVVETTTGGTNVEFASQDLLGDSNLLSHAIQSVVLGTQPGITLRTSRDAGIVAARMDMDQSQFPVDVTATGGIGIYDKLIPILQQWNQQYNFVGSYYINIGDNTANTTDPSMTDWTKSLPYYQAIQAMGGEIGNHSYTHLINPPTTTFTAHTVGTTAAGSIQVTLDTVPSFFGITVGMVVSGLNIGANVTLPGAAGEAGAVANTMVTAVSGNTVTLSFVPGGYGTLNNGVLGDIPAGTTLTFSVPAENANFLQTAATGAVNSATGFPFTYDYEFNQSKLLEQQMLGTTIYGAAVPGAAESYATSQNILQYYPSVAATATTPGYTGYVTGGWTGIGSGYPSALGYMNPTSTGSVYIAPNMTFDFTEIQYEGKTLAQAEADWTAQFNSIGANATGTPIVVWPIHDYGAAAWNTTANSPTGSPYSTQMYTDFIAQAYNAGYEFVTLEELAARIAAQQKAHIDYTTVGNTITATATPDPTAPDVGEMSLNVINGGTQVIQNVTNWYAYNAQELFLPRNGGTFTVNLGATQDNVTHIASLPMRGDLLSVAGDGLNLSFSMFGEGHVIVDLGGTGTPIVTGATIASQVGNVLDLSLTGLSQHDVTLQMAPAVTGVAASPADAILGAGATATLTVSLGQTVNVSGGAPTLTLNNGGFATYASGSGTAALTFTYTVAAGQDATQLAVTGVNLNGATVTNQAGTAADFTHAVATPPGWLEIAPSAIAAFDTTAQQPVAVVAQHYTGPVANLQGEYINITSDNLNTTASTPGWFIHSGSGMDAIAVSSGTNVLDGGTGSNFLVGGSGTDTFFMDDRQATADIWSTLVGFGAGDAATIWGITPADFNLAWLDGRGAAGYTGLTLSATADGKPSANLTLAGYTQADLTNGRLAVQFGTDSASGSTYMYIHGNG